MTKLYVGNLAFSMTDESLLQLFTGKGYKVGSARIITDRETGRSRGFGFVELGAEDDTSKAIGEFNGMEIEGRALQVNEARPQESGAVVAVGGSRRRWWWPRRIFWRTWRWRRWSRSRQLLIACWFPGPVAPGH